METPRIPIDMYMYTLLYTTAKFGKSGEKANTCKSVGVTVKRATLRFFNPISVQIHYNYETYIYVKNSMSKSSLAFTIMVY